MILHQASLTRPEPHQNNNPAAALLMLGGAEFEIGFQKEVNVEGRNPSSTTLFPLTTHY
jgi:hypothetical protein